MKITHTTTNLRLPEVRRWAELSPPVAAAVCSAALICIAFLVGQIRSEPAAPAVPTPSLPTGPIVVIQKEAQPPQVIYVQAPAPTPAVVYIDRPVYVQVEAPAAAPAPVEQPPVQVVDEPAPAVEPIAPTPVQQEPPPERQVLIQQHLANEHMPPAAPLPDHAAPPSPPDDISRAMMVAAWEEGHCIGSGAAKVCR